MRNICALYRAAFVGPGSENKQKHKFRIPRFFEEEFLLLFKIISRGMETFMSERIRLNPVLKSDSEFKIFVSFNSGRRIKQMCLIELKQSNNM